MTGDPSAVAPGLYPFSINYTTNQSHPIFPATPAINRTQDYQLVISSAIAPAITCIATDASTQGGIDGAIDLQISGGNGPFQFDWSNAATTEDLTGISAGEYCVTVSDAAGCLVEHCCEVADPCSDIEITATLTPISELGESDGAIDITVSGGSAPYNFSWSNGASTEDIANLVADSYTVTLTDQGGCTAQETYEMPDGKVCPDFDITLDGTDISMTGANDGAVDLTATGGCLPYTFDWSSGAATEDISNLGPGTYTLTLSDITGCSETDSIEILEPQPCSTLVITLDVTDASTTGGNNGSIDLTVTGGNEPYGYTWSNGGTTEDISGLIAGPYCVTVTDNFGCTANGCETVSEPPPCPTFSFNTIITPATAGSSNGMINLTVIGGIPPYTYSWSNGETTEDINSLSPGTYTVTATDANNCTGTSTFDVPGCAAITFDFGVSLPSTPGLSLIHI